MLRDEYVARFEALSAVHRAVAHDGVLDDSGDELLRYGAEGTPLVLVVQVGSHDAERVGGTVRARGLYGAYVIASNGDEQLSADASPGDLAMVIAQLLVAELMAGDPFTYAVKSPDGVVAQNFFSPELGRMGLAMWTVTWSQMEGLDTAALAGIADDLLRIHAEYDIAPPAGADLIDDIT